MTRSVEELWDLAEKLTRADYITRLDEARKRKLFRDHLAHWEVADLFSYCLPLAIFDACRTPDFPAFRELWTPLVGENAIGWLPSLYLAAVACPSVVREERLDLCLSALPFVSH